MIKAPDISVKENGTENIQFNLLVNPTLKEIMRILVDCFMKQKKCLCAMRKRF